MDLVPLNINMDTWHLYVKRFSLLIKLLVDYSYNKLKEKCKSPALLEI